MAKLLLNVQKDTRERSRWGALALCCAVLLGPGCGADEASPDAAPAASQPPPPDSVAPMQARPPEPVPPGSSDDRTVQERLRDATLAAQVKKTLLDDATLRPFDLDVAAQRGQVVVRGTVMTAAEQRRVPDVARTVDGVQTVANEVAVAADSMGGEAKAGPVTQR